MSICKNLLLTRFNNESLSQFLFIRLTLTFWWLQMSRKSLTMKKFRRLVFIDTQLKIFERVTTNEIIIYENFFVYNRFTTMTKVYLNIWRDNEKTINLSKKNWMSIFIISGAKSNASKIYSLKSKNWTLINKKFDRLHVENKMN